MPEERTLSVSQFLQTVNIALKEAVFPYGVVVEGEVSSYKVNQGKYVYFTLKDDKSKVDCFAMLFKVKTPLEDGMKVRVHGGPSIYAPYGKFSLNVDAVELVGEGALRRAFEILKKKLEAEGLFAPERKRPLPRFPERIGLIASTQSDAYADFIRILGNRWGGVTVNAAHVQVQGREAVSTIVGAFRHFNAHPELAEVLVLTRGGGSLEDLQAFNSEDVARAVFSSKIPVVVGVGHERDESLADYVADVRASTPSNAAERLVPDRRDVQREIAAAVAGMEAVLRETVGTKERRLFEFESRLHDHVRSARAEFEAVMSDLQLALSGFEHKLHGVSASVESSERLLKTLDPQAVLKRGYGIVRDAAGRIVREAAAVDKGAAINVQLHQGSLDATVNAKH